MYSESSTRQCISLEKNDSWTAHCLDLFYNEIHELFFDWQEQDEKNIKRVIFELKETKVKETFLLVFITINALVKQTYAKI